MAGTIPADWYLCESLKVETQKGFQVGVGKRASSALPKQHLLWRVGLDQYLGLPTT